MFDGYSDDFADYQRPTITLPSYYQLAFLPTAAGSASAADDMRERPKKEQSDEFLMYTYKVKSCSKKKSHDWTACPYAHRGEKARRRDPRKFPYSAAVCPEYRQRGDCCRGQACEFAHGVFEFWLHPARFRTKMCDAGPACSRKICFFAHAPEQLRPAAVQYCLRCGGSVCLGSSTEGGDSSSEAAAAGACTGACLGNSYSEEMESSEAAAYCASAGTAGDGINGFASADGGDGEEEDYAGFPHLDWILDIVN
ncbi:zinc finger CCCH domain-containing protein 54-like [Ananas comosus]|uniref:Zinc finger CCCH domain-containing protein 54-like n=1 Tax=Ananas comosus TaxID=4615 RepID=A0A6P5HAS1_ANACO|nr:zinc finger CCCH domain-containing protein 54-like [Ananas comosus]